MMQLFKKIPATALFMFACSHLAAQEVPVDSVSKAVLGSESEDVSNPGYQLDGDKPKPHIYRVNYWVSGSICAVSTALDIYAIPNIIKSKPQLTDAEMAALDRDKFNWFDRWALEQDGSKRPDFYKASDLMLPGIIVSAAALGLDKNIRKDWFRIFLMYYEMHGLTFSMYNFSFLGPAFQNKVRPYAYYDQDFPLSERRTGNQRNSLFSGHTATAVASTYFMVKVYSDYHPELGRKKYLLYGLASIPPLIEGYLRVKALAHFPSDVMVGFLVGAACGIAVPSLHRYKDREVRVGLNYTPAGPGLTLNWQPKIGDNTPKGIGF